MNTKVLSILSIFLLIFSIIVFFNRKTEPFDEIEDSVVCRNLEIPSKCRLLHTMWKDYDKTSKNILNNATKELSSCSNELQGNASSIILSRLQNALNIINMHSISEKYEHFTCAQWVDEYKTNDMLKNKVNKLEGELLSIIRDEAAYNKDEELSSNSLVGNNIDDLLTNYCKNNENKETDKYSHKDIMKALWCKLACGRRLSGNVTSLDDLFSDTY